MLTVPITQTETKQTKWQQNPEGYKKILGGVGYIHFIDRDDGITGVCLLHFLKLT